VRKRGKLMQHLDEGVLNAVVDGEVPSSELESIQAHLDACSECRARLNETRAFADESEGLVELIEVPPRSKPSAPVIASPGWGGGRFRNLAWAATVVAALGIGYVTGNRPFTAPQDVAFRQTPVVGGTVGDQPVTDDLQPAATPQDSGATFERAAETVVGERLADADTRQTPATPEAPATAGRQDTGPVELAEARANEVEQARPTPEVTTGDAREETRRERDVGRVAADLAKVAAPSSTVPLKPLASGQIRALVAADEVQPQTLARRFATAFVTVTLKEASTVLGGSLRLIDGMIPDRLEASASTVRVIYPMMSGELVLEQRRDADSVIVSLTGPTGLSPDSLAVLRARVR
jgi:hypothetical protein